MMFEVRSGFSLDRDFMPIEFMRERLGHPELALGEVLADAAPDSPYIARGLRRRQDLAEAFGTTEALPVLSSALADVSTLALADADPDVVRACLRRSKEAFHLALAAADLAGRMSQNAVTGHLSDFADACVATALASACYQHAEQPEGVFVLAMGKHGASELNYSSDVDLIVLYDPELFAPSAANQQQRAVRLAQTLTSVLQDRTSEGYVFRVDLRLRPDPNSTPAAISTRYALGYYEAQGQTWERMAFIKARPVAGDMAAASRFLSALSPFIWRRNLDYWALADIHAIKRQIHAHHRHGALTEAGFDAKLGRGGIREIEFLAQTQQLILGGRPEGAGVGLRARTTREAIEGLVRFGVMKPPTAEALWQDYCALRLIEHRCQLVDDQQTHAVPDAHEARAAIARLAGVTSLSEFDRLTIDLRRRVHTEYARLFQAEDIQGQTLEGAPRQASFVFTGVELDPATLNTLSELGFSDPAGIISSVRDWHRGRVRAARSPRGRQLLTLLTPQLMVAMGQTGEPDHAFQRFEDFIRELRAGAQTLSLFLAQPEIMAETLANLTLAPRLALDLARQPALIDALLTPQFFSPVTLDPEGRVRSELAAVAKAAPDTESLLDHMRRAHRELMLRIKWQTLSGLLGVEAAGLACADLADATVEGLMPSVVSALEARHGPMPGRAAVLALGSFGGQEMHATSDLDLMLVYDVPESAENGPVFFARLMQRLLSALTSPTAEGRLYDVDMQLRPNGNAGPAAVRLSSYRAYYQREAWTWELMALTRMRPVWGDVDLCAEISVIARQALNGASTRPDTVRSDIAEMRRRMAEHRPATSIWDLKLTSGGLVDIEFIVQQWQLLAGDAKCIRANTVAALAAIAETDKERRTDAAVLTEAHRLLTSLRQLTSICLEGGTLSPEAASAGLRKRLAALAGVDSFGALEDRLRESLRAVAAIRAREITVLASDGTL